jgi:hypothetical protein
MCALRAGVKSTLGIDSGSGIGAVEERHDQQNHSNEIHRLSPIAKMSFVNVADRPPSDRSQRRCRCEFAALVC